MGAAGVGLTVLAVAMPALQSQLPIGVWIAMIVVSFGGWTLAVAHLRRSRNSVRYVVHPSAALRRGRAEGVRNR